MRAHFTHRPNDNRSLNYQPGVLQAYIFFLGGSFHQLSAVILFATHIAVHKFVEITVNLICFRPIVNAHKLKTKINFHTPCDLFFDLISDISKKRSLSHTHTYTNRNNQIVNEMTKDMNRMAIDCVSFNSIVDCGYMSIHEYMHEINRILIRINVSW